MRRKGEQIAGELLHSEGKFARRLSRVGMEQGMTAALTQNLSNLGNGLNDTRLEKDLSDMHSKIAENLDAITEIFAYFETKRDEYSEKNRSAIEAIEAAAAADAAN